MYNTSLCKKKTFVQLSFQKIFLWDRAPRVRFFSKISMSSKKYGSLIDTTRILYIINGGIYKSTGVKFHRSPTIGNRKRYEVRFFFLECRVDIIEELGMVLKYNDDTWQE